MLLPYWQETRTENAKVAKGRESRKKKRYLALRGLATAVGQAAARLDCYAVSFATFALFAPSR
jgi:hypothetical protein